MMFLVAGFGNPLLDITVKINSDELLKKYNLKEDDQVDISSNEIQMLYADISTCSNHISAGGCAQNTIRVLQWLLNDPNKTVYFGGIGNDEQGSKLTQLVQNAGVLTRYIIHENESTGTCIALVKGASRSLVAHLGAAECFDIAAITNEESLSILKSVKIIYMEGFFITKRQEVAKHIREISTSNKSVFAFNLSGVYINDLYPLDLAELAKSCDVLFGNKNEFSALGKTLNIDDPKNVCIMLSKIHTKYDTTNLLLRFGKIVVMTNGSKNVSCVFNDGNVIDFEVPKISLDKIQDTTGAGDSFVAGFLTGLLMNFNIEKCLELGCWTASQIIQQVGCTIPNFAPDIRNI